MSWGKRRQETYPPVDHMVRNCAFCSGKQQTYQQSDATYLESLQPCLCLYFLACFFRCISSFLFYTNHHILDSRQSTKEEELVNILAGCMESFDKSSRFLVLLTKNQTISYHRERVKRDWIFSQHQQHLAH